MLLFYASPKASYCTGQSIKCHRRSGDVLINSGDPLRISARLIECLMRYAHQAYQDFRHYITEKLWYPRSSPSPLSPGVRNWP